MPLDCADLDQSLRRAWADWCATLAELREAPRAEVPSPIERWQRLWSERTLGELAEQAHHPLAAALYGWCRALAVEHAAWASRVEEAVGWATPVRVLDESVTLRELRRRALCTPDPAERRGWGGALGAVADRVCGAICRGIAQRREVARAMARPASLRGAVGVAPATAARAAEALLAATDSLVHDERAQHFTDGLQQTLARGADAGWPAALSARTIRSLAGAIEGPRPRAAAFAVPEAWGALSFARALGNLGVALLDAERSAAAEFAPVMHPFGLKRHERFALFASLVGERSFARRSLGLGQERARAHQRMVGRAWAHALRFDALRVLVTRALGGSLDEAHERFHELAPRVFGAAVPSSLLAVLPAARVGAGAMLVGRLLAVRARHAVTEELGEDWYRNPRSHDWLAQCARRPEGIEPLAVEPVLGAVAELGRLLESIC